MSRPLHLYQHSTVAVAEYFSHANVGSKLCRIGLWITPLENPIKIAFVHGSVTSYVWVLSKANGAHYERTDSRDVFVHDRVTASTSLTSSCAD
jgi:hypothetical protein